MSSRHGVQHSRCGDQSQGGQHYLGGHQHQSGKHFRGGHQSQSYHHDQNHFSKLYNNKKLCQNKFAHVNELEVHMYVHVYLTYMHQNICSHVLIFM